MAKPKKRLIVVCGLPGVGKSYISEILKKKIGGSLYFDSDQYGKLYMEKNCKDFLNLPPREQEKARLKCHKEKIEEIVRQFLAHDTIIVDTCFDIPASRVMFYGAAEYNKFEIVALEVVCPEEVVRLRIFGNRHEAERMVGTKVTRWELNQERKKAWEPITGKKFVIHSERDVEPQVNEFLARFRFI